MNKLFTGLRLVLSIVIIDNFQGHTAVRTISAGSSEGMIFNFDWGAADHFTRSVEKILAEYIVER